MISGLPNYTGARKATISVGSIQYAATWYLPAWVLALKGDSDMGSRVIGTQVSEPEVHICYMKCM